MQVMCWLKTSNRLRQNSRDSWDQLLQRAHIHSYAVQYHGQQRAELRSPTAARPDPIETHIHRQRQTTNKHPDSVVDRLLPNRRPADSFLCGNQRGSATRSRRHHATHESRRDLNPAGCRVRESNGGWGVMRDGGREAGTWTAGSAKETAEAMR